MNLLFKNIILIVCCLFPHNIAKGLDLVVLLEQEAKRELETLSKETIPAYYISYRVDDIKYYNSEVSFGTLIASNENGSHTVTITVRVGSPDKDNTHLNTVSMEYSLSDIPLAETPIATRNVLWVQTHQAYLHAVGEYIKSTGTVKVEEDKSPDFSTEKTQTYIESPLNIDNLEFDNIFWENQLKKYTSCFLKDSSIFIGNGSITFIKSTKYFASSDGDKIIQNSIYTSLYIMGAVQALDGMQLPLYLSYFSKKPDDLPSDASINNDVDEMVKNLIALKSAPIADSYGGPAILSGRAAAVFFHEIFGHRIEGQRMKSEKDAQTFKKKINEQILPSFFNVYCDPQLKKYNGIELRGYYLYDDQGIKGQHVNIVENGILKNFLMSRTPINGFNNSNGHGRSEPGYQPVARQSNLIIESTQPHPYSELLNELIKLIKAQNKTYGYLIEDVYGGFTKTTRFSPNAFNIRPTLVYRIYADGRKAELVRGVNLIGTPLSMFSQIEMTGDRADVFNGVCGAESGKIPVSAVCPSLLIRTIETQKVTKTDDMPFILSRPDFKQ